MPTVNLKKTQVKETATNDLSNGVSISDQYVVEYDAGTTTERTWTANKEAGVPRIGDAHPSNNRLRVVSTSTVPGGQDDNSSVFFVTVEYKENEFGVGTVTAPPTLTPTYRKFGLSRVRPIETDVDGFPIQNSVGDPFVPAYEDEEHYTGLQITVQVPFVKWEQIKTEEYRDTVNNKILFGEYQPGTAKLVSIEETSQLFTYNDIREYIINMSFTWHIRKTWRAEIVDAGMSTATVDARQINPSHEYQTESVRITSVENKKRVLDDESIATTDPVLLNGKGEKLPDGADPIVFKYQVKLDKDHNELLKNLGIPTTIRGILNLAKGKQ